MMTTVIMAGLSMLLGLIGIIIGAVGGHFSFASLMILLGSVLAIPAVMMKNECLMKGHVGTALGIIIVAIVVGVIVAFVGAVGAAICDAYMAHEDLYYICKNDCTGTSNV